MYCQLASVGMVFLLKVKAIVCRRGAPNSRSAGADAAMPVSASATPRRDLAAIANHAAPATAIAAVSLVNERSSTLLAQSRSRELVPRSAQYAAANASASAVTPIVSVSGYPDHRRSGGNQSANAPAANEIARLNRRLASR